MSAKSSSVDTLEREHERPISAFTHGAVSRRLLRRARVGAAATAAAAADDKPWGLLYRALTNSLGASPSNFQLVYPFVSWTWPTPAAGTTSGAQYDFCSTAPQWDAVGAYASGGDRVDLAYQQFLQVIPVATDDPILRDKINIATDAQTEASNQYTLAVSIAETAYADKVSGNTPPFTAWLGTPAGLGYQSNIAAAQKKMDQARVNLDALVEQANTPGLADARNQFANQDFYVRLADPNLSKLPKVPNWSISQNAAQWLDKVKAGKGPSGATMGFNNRESSYDYSKTWAGGQAKISQLFWEVRVNGKWERIDSFEMDDQLEVSLEFDAIDLIQIQPSPWYNGGFVRSMGNGPFVRGYSPYGEDGTQAVFGENGFFNLFKTGMYVGYKPSFSIRTSSSTFRQFSEKFKVATGLRIGPFTFEAEGGSEKSGWHATENGSSFTGTTSSDQPMIIGIQITKLPKAGD